MKADDCCTVAWCDRTRCEPTRGAVAMAVVSPWSMEEESLPCPESDGLDLVEST
jgi:hypothetical protein